MFTSKIICISDITESILFFTTLSLNVDKDGKNLNQNLISYNPNFIFW